ncbi:DnAJ-like protein [Portunus trituberculatus]|uniref:DnAJ-like protein n=1 Tax=Portunus trituberculatus TaxID=210409 RepID=A0A5B7G1J2_PORTR|nr:DnAJ-like protein [Portunus trituberculatus]
MTHKADYYEVLGVAKDDTTGAIKKQFRRLALVTHPDKNPHDVQGATVKFQLLQRAADTLSDPDKRARHDATLRGNRPHRGPQAQDTKAKASSNSSSSRKFSFSSPSSQSFTFKYKGTGAGEVSAKEKSARKRRRQRQNRKEQRQQDQDARTNWG